MATVSKDLPIGYEFPPVTRVMTLERMALYIDMETSATTGPHGTLRVAPKNIHNDVQYARSFGLANPIADGVISSAWVEGVLLDMFGTGYLKGGKVLTKFIKPIFADDVLTIKMTLKEKVPEGDATRFVLDITLTNQKGDVVVAGSGGGLVA